jgi:hypothetical protein
MAQKRGCFLVILPHYLARKWIFSGERMSVAIQLKEMRKRAGLTQGQLAERAVFR